MKKNNKLKNNKKTLIIALISIFVIVLIITSIFVINSIVKQKEIENTYESAITYVKEKEYTKAIDSFNKIKDYKDSKQQITKTYYLYAKEEVKKENYAKALELFEKCIEYEDTKDLIIETKYNYAMSLIENDEKKAIEILREISDYKDSKELIDSYDYKHRYDGTYMYNDTTLSIEQRYTIIGNKAYFYFYRDKENIVGEKVYSSGYWSMAEFSLNCEDKSNICTYSNGNYNYTYKFTENTLIKSSHNNNPDNWEKEHDLINLETTFKKISKDTELPQERKIVGSNKPKIGMTQEEVRKSSWGEPKDINKNTYSWGTTEQWVYYDNKYIYFKNGKVTSISE